MGVRRLPLVEDDGRGPVVAAAGMAGWGAVCTHAHPWLHAAHVDVLAVRPRRARQLLLLLLVLVLVLMLVLVLGGSLL
jgi:hypothetical protein